MIRLFSIPKYNLFFRISCYFLFYFLYSSFCYAQQNNSIIGKWKVVAVMDDNYYYHFDKDSTILSNEYKASLAASKKDTIEAMAMVKYAMKIFDNSFFQFKKDSTFQINIGMQEKETGYFSVDTKHNKITAFINSNTAIPKEDIYFYTIEKNKMQLSMPIENNDLIFYLVKN